MFFTIIKDESEAEKLTYGKFYNECLKIIDVAPQEIKDKIDQLSLELTGPCSGESNDWVIFKVGEQRYDICRITDVVRHENIISIYGEIKKENLVKQNTLGV